MAKKYSVLIIGGYGNFGQYIAKSLGQNPLINLWIAGPNLQKAKAMVASLKAVNPVKACYCDINLNLDEVLNRIKPFIVIHTSGPFQQQEYLVAKACLIHRCHYLDLADSRQFVTGISQFNEQAKNRNLLLCSGVSSVPGLSSAVIDHYSYRFSQLESIDYAITTAQLTNQGLATTAGVLSYAGKPFMTRTEGKPKTIFGWQGLRLKQFWRLNSRLLCNCDIPDLELFPKYYPSLKTIRFQAGLELKSLQLGLFFLSWLVRLKLLPSLDKFAKKLFTISQWFNRFGTNNSGFFMQLKGLDKKSKPLRIDFEIYAQEGDGLFIPCIPALLLTEALINNETALEKGALPCIGVINLNDYLNKIRNLGLKISWRD